MHDKKTNSLEEKSHLYYYKPQSNIYEAPNSDSEALQTQVSGMTGK